MKLVMDFILISGIVINVLILILLFKIKQKQQPHRILVVFFTLLLTGSLFTYGQIHQVDWLVILFWIPAEVTPWCIPPLLLLYVKSVFHDSEGKLKQHRFHFIPSLLYISFIAIPFLVSWLQKAFLFDYLIWLKDHGSEYLVIVRSFYHLVYTSLTLALFFKYRRLLESNFSSLSEKEFLWIKYLLVGTILVVSIDLLTKVLYLVFDVRFGAGSQRSGGTLVMVAMIFLISYLGYYGVNQSRILLPQFLLLDAGGSKNRNAKIAGYAFTAVEIQSLEDAIKKLFEEDKPYLDEDLTLHKLATLLGIGDKKLSTFLNQHLKTTFFDLVNKARVASVQEKMTSDEYDRYTLLGIAYESGFKSKTSFNRIFKKETGLSPSAFRKRQK